MEFNEASVNFYFVSSSYGDPALLKAGEYQVTRTMTPREFKQCCVGRVKQRNVIFIEGWTFYLKEGLKADSHIQHTVDKLSDQNYGKIKR